MYQLHINNKISATTYDVGRELARVIYNISDSIGGKIAIETGYMGTSNYDQYYRKIEFDLDMDESDIGEHNLETVIEMIREEIERHPMFGDFQLEREQV